MVVLACVISLTAGVCIGIFCDSIKKYQEKYWRCKNKNLETSDAFASFSLLFDAAISIQKLMKINGEGLLLFFSSFLS